MDLHDFNTLGVQKAEIELLKCCGSSNWVSNMLLQYPFKNKAVLLKWAEKYWYEHCQKTDWLEAFSHHPKIGDLDSLTKKFAATKDWSAGEQSGVDTASQQTLEALAAGNQTYENKFGYIFIVCATGKSAGEMLALLEARLDNKPEDEIHIAMGEQHKITLIRLEKLFL